MAPLTIETERLLLRPWEERDRAPFAALNADPLTMEHLLHPLSREESDASIDRVRAHYEEHGFGFMAVEEKASGLFVGMVGLAHVPFEAHFTPAVEIGWRIVRPAWGRGFAPEAAAAALSFGFRELQLDEIVAFTIAANTRSQRVMEKIGMQRDLEGDFEHPRVPLGNPKRPHLLYRLRPRTARQASL